MNLSAEQNAFLWDFAKWILFVHADDPEMQLTEGEGSRTIEQQQIYVNTGKSKTMNSNHIRKLAHDVNFIKNGKMVTDHPSLKKYADYWKGLNPLNRWGGDFSTIDDYDHFERNAV
jgi:hypothetical protein